MINHKIIRSKMKKTGALLGHPILANHVPKTVWCNLQNLHKMISLFRVIYVKPDAGHQGHRVFRVHRINEHEGVLSSQNASRKIALPGGLTELLPIISKNQYIIQQGIDLATLNNRPFDIRVIMQKPYATWELTLTSAKVALKEDAVVTNVARGAEDYPLNHILQVYDQKQDPMATLREIVDLAHQMAGYLSTKFPLRIIGFDLALDKKGKVWFIEANTWPQCARCKLVNDKVSRRKYERSSKIMGFKDN
mgnify:FL=1